MANPCDFFPCKSFLESLEEISKVKSPSSLLVWLGLAPPRVEAFCWLMVLVKVSIANNLPRRGIVLKGSSDVCVLCGRKREDIDHFFVYCDFAHFLWCQFLGE